MKDSNHPIWIPEYSDNEIDVLIGKYLRDKGWDFCFGNIQETLRTTTATTLRLRFEGCVWADPLPLLSLATTVREWLSRGKAFHLYLPDIKAIENEQKGFLAFLTKERFLDTFLNTPGGDQKGLVRVFDQNKEITSDIRSYREEAISLSSYMVYQNPTCITAQIIDLSRCEDISLVVDELIEQAKMKGLKRYIASYASSLKAQDDTNAMYTIQELRQILIELLRNVQEHAYDERFSNIKTSFAAVYARVRFGLIDERGTGQKFRLKENFDQENRHCPKLEFSGNLQQIGFIELFVSDAGIGIAKHFQEQVKSNHSLKHFFTRMTTNEAFSRYNKEQREKIFRSPMPGLRYISDMLSERSGFMRILYKNEWCGTSFPIAGNPKISSTVRAYHPIKDKRLNFPKVGGTHITARISTGTPEKLPQGWDYAILPNFSYFNTSKIIQAYRSTTTFPEDWSKVEFSIYDDQATYLDKGTKVNHYRLTVGDQGEAISYILWRPRKTIFRDELIKRLKKFEFGQGVNHIIIVDQDLAAALMTQWALNKSKQDWFPGIDCISIITDSLCSSDLLAIDSCFQTPDQNTFAKTGNQRRVHLGHIVYALREMDSKLYWEQILKPDQRKNVFIRHDIEWQSENTHGSPLSISNFINFLHTTIDVFYRKVLFHRKRNPKGN